MKQARTEFHDGQRVRREDLEYLQNNLLQGLQDVRLALGVAGVSWGYRVSAGSDTHLLIRPGLAIDPWGRPLVHIEEKQIEIPFNGDDMLCLCAAYESLVATEINGRPAHIAHGVTFSFKAAVPAGADAEIPIAQIRPREGGYEIIQHGAWYLPPLGAGYSGHFYEDRQGRWRYDGNPLQSVLLPHFDSGWVSLDAGSDKTLEHGLRSQDLLVQLQSRPVLGTVSNKGYGIDYWYEIHGDHTVRILNNSQTETELRIMLWRISGPAAGPMLPVADAGLDREVEYGESFALDGSDSRGFEGHSIVRYFWTIID